MPTRARPCCSHRGPCETWCVAFASCGSEAMPIPIVEIVHSPHGGASRGGIVPTREIAVQRLMNRVRWWRRHHARAARRDRHDPWHAWRLWCPLGTRRRSRGQACLHGRVRSRLCHRETRSRGDRRRGRVTSTHTALVMPTCDARGGREPREGLVADDRTLRRTPSLRDAGASLRPRDVWVRESIGRDSSCARSIQSIDTRDEVLLARARRSASRDPRRRLARIRIHPVCPGCLPSGARPGHGGAPA